MPIPWALLTAAVVLTALHSAAGPAAAQETRSPSVTIYCGEFGRFISPLCKDHVQPMLPEDRGVIPPAADSGRTDAGSPRGPEIFAGRPYCDQLGFLVSQPCPPPGEVPGRSGGTSQ